MKTYLKWDRLLLVKAIMLLIIFQVNAQYTQSLPNISNYTAKNYFGGIKVFGNIWRKYFENESRIENDHDGMIKNKLNKNKRSYAWSVIGDWTLRLRYLPQSGSSWYIGRKLRRPSPKDKMLKFNRNRLLTLLKQKIKSNREYKKGRKRSLSLDNYKRVKN